jgi:quinol monooxygenase YgiN
MIIVTGSIVARPDTFDRMLALSLEHVHRSRTEPGCLSHAVYRDVENPLRVFFFEEWADRNALAAHFAVAASGAFVKEVRSLASELSPIGVFDASPVNL